MYTLSLSYGCIESHKCVGALPYYEDGHNVGRKSTSHHYVEYFKAIIQY